jgi:N-acylneuraminate cytidylyltransferase
MIKSKKVYSFVFARKGSKGLRNKNLKKFKNKQFIYYSWKLFKRSRYIDKIFLSTDSEKLMKVAKKIGLRVPFKRPNSLSRDDSPELNAWKHIIGSLKHEGDDFDIFVSLPLSNPIKPTKYFNKALIHFEKNKFDMLMCISKIKYNPDYNIVTKKGKFIEKFNETTKAYQRQMAKQAYSINPMFYIATKNFIKKTSNLNSGKIGYFEIPNEINYDIDTMEDLNELKKVSNKTLKKYKFYD